jgi:bifunctional enzyme CysN/CysC
MVGRLLHDTRTIARDKLEKVKRICRDQGKQFEYAFLLDAFEEEQKQGITIDVSQIRFSTKRRDYLLIDTPGHKEFLKNMFSGASSAQAAIVLIDAAEGVRAQTRQHAHLLKLLGIRQIVVAVSKIDRVGYSRKTVQAISREYREYLKQLGFKRPPFIPMAAVTGENVLKRGKNTAWYKGPTLCEALDRFVSDADDPARLPFRMMVQDVYKFDTRRLIAGRIESGTLRPGDTVLFSPGSKTEKVRSIETWPETKRIQAGAGQSVAFTLENQIFVERGQICSSVERPPHLADEFAGNLFWMGDKPLRLNHRYYFRLGTQEMECRVERIKNVLSFENAPTGDRPNQVERYEVGEVVFRTRRPVAFDDFLDVPQTGRFVVVDGHAVCGGGVAYLGEYPDLRKGIGDEIKSKNISWHESKIGRKERQGRYGHEGAVIWLTGLSGAGKSTIAVELEKKLFMNRIHSFILDGDNVRHGLNANLGFSPDDRVENIRRIGEVANLFSEAGLVVITAFISPYAKGRDRVRRRVKQNFLEVHLDCPLSVCEKRDAKGLYKKARKGLIQHFTGISAPYEPPKKPEIVLQTGRLNVGECVDQIVSELTRRKIIPKLY